jgi:hypothetical protein
MWMADKLPSDKLATKVDTLISEWTRNDYRAVGEWIVESPEGPAKQAAVTAYAAGLAPHEPLSAAQWVLTLPAGKVREKLLRNIHTEWKRKDQPAAAEFARQQGLRR